jgi:all-trans-retinol 13,14-reductase
MPRDDNYGMIIIGGGLAGLACGALLAKQGHRPLITEMNEQVGNIYSLVERFGIREITGVL